MNPKATRISGEIRFLSNEYLTKNATPRNSANPPTQANILTPMNCSQLIFATGSSGGRLIGGKLETAGSGEGMGGGAAAGSVLGIGGGTAGGAVGACLKRVVSGSGFGGGTGIETGAPSVAALDSGRVGSGLVFSR